MHDTELYRQILGLTPPWTVTSVALDLMSKTVTIPVDSGSVRRGSFESVEDLQDAITEFL